MSIRRPDRALRKDGSEFDLIHAGVAATPVPRHLDRLVHDSLGTGGRPRTHARYPAHALLVGLILLVWLKRPLTLAGLLQMFWEELTPAQRSILGLDPIIGGDRRRLWDTVDGHKREYNRLQRDFDAIVNVLDPSPFADQRSLHRKQRLTVGERHQILAELTEEKSRELCKKERRLDWVMNTMLGAFIGDRPEDYDGSHVGDATIIEANATTRGTGYRQAHLKYGADLDATWWDTTKSDQNSDRPSPVERAGRITSDAKKAASTSAITGNHGSTAEQRRRDGRIWGFAVHLTQRTHRLYGREVAKVATGICITRALGGDTAAALRAVRGHIANGQGPALGQQVDAIWDNGYTNLNGFAAGLLPLGYRVVRDYNSGHKPMRKNPSTGVILWQGAELCPGALDVVDPYTRYGGWQAYPGDAASDAAVDAHTERMNHILSFRLATNGVIRYAPLAPGIAAKRKERGEPDGPYVASRGCPARAGTCACPLVPASLDKGLPLVPTPPVPKRNADSSDTRAYSICGDKSYTEIRYTDPEFKFLTPYVHGTERHTHRYRARGRNEGYNSDLKNPSTGNLRPEVFDLHGLARVGLLVTASAIVTNIRSLKSFQDVLRKNGGKPPYEDSCAARDALRARAHHFRDRRHTRPSHTAPEDPLASQPVNPMLVIGDRRRRPKR